MGEFFAFVVIVFSAVWGSLFLGAHLRRINRNLESGADAELQRRMLESLDQLEKRLAVLEEEMGFYRELQRPVDAPELPPPSEPS